MRQSPPLAPSPSRIFQHIHPILKVHVWNVNVANAVILSKIIFSSPKHHMHIFNMLVTTEHIFILVLPYIEAQPENCTSRNCRSFFPKLFFIFKSHPHLQYTIFWPWEIYLGHRIFSWAMTGKVAHGQKNVVHGKNGKNNYSCFFLIEMCMALMVN